VVEAADQWKQCERIHAFIRHIEERAARNPEHSGSPELAQWLAWVRARVDEADPTEATLKAAIRPLRIESTSAIHAKQPWPSFDRAAPEDSQFAHAFPRRAPPGGYDAALSMAPCARAAKA
jgi:hypothetical protein